MAVCAAAVVRAQMRHYKELLAAATAHGFGDRPPDRPRMRLVGFKPMVKGSLKGFVSIELPPGLVIEDCPIFLSHGKAWAALPAKAVLDREGRHAKPDGKPQYTPVLR